VAGAGAALANARMPGEGSGPRMLCSRRMFGLGLGEIILIVIVALLFIGPEKLPEAAKSISKGIRDIRKQTRELRETIEDDSEFGGAIRDLQSALRGDELHASAQARQKAAALKSATLKPAPGTEIAVGPGAGPSAGTTGGATAGTAGSAGGAPPAVPAVGAPVIAAPGEPVIAASAGAVARGGVIEPAAATPGSESPTSAEQKPGEGTAGSTPAPGRAHG
jgi:sec-independent protein translocase protein TatB